MEMNQNSRFSVVTDLDFQRSKFDRDHTYTTTFNTGELIPFYCDEVLPGDTFNVKTAKVVRMQTPATPFADNLYLDTYYFFVPLRLVWEHLEEFFGENKTGPWIPTTTYQIPQITPPTGGWTKGSIADYLGFPTLIDNYSVSALPFRAYALVCDQWFRSEVLTNPLYIPLGDATQTGTNGTNYITDVANGGAPFKVARYFDYFSSSLPAPQRGPSVGIGITGNVPVVTSNDHIDWTTMPKNATGSTNLIHFIDSATGTTSPSRTGAAITSNGLIAKDLSSGGNSINVTPDNLYADMTSVTGISINALRIAFQTQRYYEALARTGGRYISQLKTFFGVTSPDARLQRTEFLGGSRTPINVNQVVQSANVNNSYLGDTGAYSLTNDSSEDFEKSFTEHGIVLGVMAVRYDHSYQQGINKMWKRKDPLDFYNIKFANIGEEPVYNYELYATGTSTDDEVFGYNEAWSSYRYFPNQITGEMRSNYAQSLDVWHLADDYSQLPTLSDDWLRENPNSVDRVLTVAHTVADQFFANILIKNTCSRVMPLYSTPGLIDHN